MSAPRRAQGAAVSQSASAQAQSAPGGAQGRSAVLHDQILNAMSEREFQKHVRQALADRGWEVYVFPVMKMTKPGWPDIAAANKHQPGRLLLWELKTQTGRVRPEQKALLATLAKVPGVDARIVRPGDWEALRDHYLDPQPAASAAAERGGREGE